MSIIWNEQTLMAIGPPEPKIKYRMTACVYLNLSFKLSGLRNKIDLASDLVL